MIFDIGKSTYDAPPILKTIIKAILYLFKPDAFRPSFLPSNQQSEYESRQLRVPAKNLLRSAKFNCLFKLLLNSALTFNSRLTFGAP